MRQRILIIFLSFIVALFGSLLLRERILDSVAPQSEIFENTGNEVVPDHTIDEKGLFSLIQAWRQTDDCKPGGCKPYIISQSMCKLAEERTNEIGQDWSHNEFVPTVKANNYYGFNAVAENLSKGMYSEDQVLREWLASASHSANLRKPYTHSCIKCKDGRCAQTFASY